MKLPVVTIGIPCRNAQQWIAAAVESALAQEAVRPDVVVVDDGSTDDSLAILDTFGDRIRVFRHAGEGAPSARNRALAEAHGDWIQFLDADDYLLPDKIQRQLNAADSFPAGMVPYSPVLSETWRDGKVVSLAADAIDPVLDIYSQWLLWQMPQTGGVLWPVQTLRSLGGWKPDQPCCQEHELYLRALQSGIGFGFASDARAVYRLWSEDTLCRKDPAQVIRVRSGLLAAMLDWLESSGRIQPQHRQYAGRAFFEMARTLATRDPSGAAQYHAYWRQQGLIRPEGAAAPAIYRAFYRCFGFAFAERIAAWLR